MTGGGGRGFTGVLRRGVEQIDKKDQREFLPAALEILETPPSPAGRAVALTIGAFFVIAVSWAFLGKVDISATAPGRVVPAGMMKVVQPLDPGTVRAIHVQDGDHVKAGQLLIELDPTVAGADREKLAQDLAQARLDVARLTALKRTAETGAPPGRLVPPPGADPIEVEQASAALRAQADQRAAKLADLDEQISEKRAEAGEVAAQIAKLNASLPMLAEKARLHQRLRDEGYGTSFANLDAQQALSDARHDVTVQAARADETNATRESLERQREEAASTFAAGVLDDLAKAEEKENELTQEFVKAQSKSGQTELRAPTDGVVEQLAVHTVGGVVTPAQRLLVVVPDNDRLQVEAQLANRDVGFVHPGQLVSVKVETFNFTKYGQIHGKVMEVSRTAVSAADRRVADTGGGGPGAADAAEAATQGAATYVARISLDRTSMVVDGVRHALVPDMAVTAEIRTGRRTIIDYLLSPLARKTQESLHER
jgi:hemolysin D